MNDHLKSSPTLHTQLCYKFWEEEEDYGAREGDAAIRKAHMLQMLWALSCEQDKEHPYDRTISNTSTLRLKAGNKNTPNIYSCNQKVINQQCNKTEFTKCCKNVQYVLLEHIFLDSTDKKKIREASHIPSKIVNKFKFVPCTSWDVLPDGHVRHHRQSDRIMSEIFLSALKQALCAY